MRRLSFIIRFHGLRITKRGIGIAVLLAAMAMSSGCVASAFRKAMYHPQRYSADWAAANSMDLEWVRYRTAQGNQVAFYRAPAEWNTAVPEKLWMLFNGNGSTALDWIGVVERATRALPGDGFLLFDYPGYGACEGAPSRKAIRESSDAALEALARYLGVPTSELEARLCVLGFSMGTGTGLEFAARHPARRIILLAPFTSTDAMVRRVVGWPLCRLAPDRFDSPARIREIISRSPPPVIDIFHGDADTVVPFSMGEALAAVAGESGVLHRIPGAGHFNFPNVLGADLVRCIASTARR